MENVSQNNSMKKDVFSDLADAPDRFHPFLVKELRRSLKGRGFIIGLSIFLFVLSLATLGMISESSTSPRAGDGIWGIVLFLQTVYFLLVIPFTNAQTDHEDGDDSMVDLIRLTAMSPMSVSLGRWITAVFFVMIYGVLVVPYYLLRYFLGGYNLSEGLTIFGVTLLGSLIACAWSTASTYLLSKRMRGVFNVGLVVLSVGFLQSFTLALRGVGWGSASLAEWIGIVFFALSLSLMLVALGANGLASRAQRRMLWVRGPWFALLAVTSIAGIFSLDEFYLAFSFILVFVGLFFICVEEPALPTEFVFPRSTKSRSISFFRKVFEYPGVGYGFWLWLLGSVLFFGAFAAHSKWNDELEEVLWVFLSIGSMIVWAYFIARKLVYRFPYLTAYILAFTIVIISNVILVFVGAASDNFGQDTVKFVTDFFPLSVLFDMNSYAVKNYAYVVYLYTGASFLAFMFGAFRERSRLFSEEKAMLS
ncbi:MAG: hypothetical protein ACPGN3_02860 [Opitutales bacterium]